LKEPHLLVKHQFAGHEPASILKSNQDFICVHDEALSVAMRVSNPDCSLAIKGTVAALY